MRGPRGTWIKNKDSRMLQNSSTNIQLFFDVLGHFPNQRNGCWNSKTNSRRLQEWRCIRVNIDDIIPSFTTPLPLPPSSSSPTFTSRKCFPRLDSLSIVLLDVFYHQIWRADNTKEHNQFKFCDQSQHAYTNS